jgi:creatinine amidohydrolase/Fe(II)-dependent formamide hydrolase-like protein
MNKLIAIVAALATTSSLYATSAEAGCGGGYGFYRSAYRSVARVSKPRIARKTSSTSVAAVVKPEVKAETKQVADAQTEKADTTLAVSTTPVTENSSIATSAAKVADAKPADAKATEKVASAAKDVGCKQFFPSAGLTVSVPCTK